MSEIQMNPPAEVGSIVFYGVGGKTIVTIKATGAVELGEGVTPTEAAKQFWKTLEEANPVIPEFRQAVMQVTRLHEILETVRGMVKVGGMDDALKEARAFLMNLKRR